MAIDSPDSTHAPKTPHGPHGPGKAIAIGLFGPAIIWFLHLFLVALIAEWGVFSGVNRQHFLNISVVSWLAGFTSVIAIVATVFAIRLVSKIDKSILAPSDTINDQDNHKTFLESVAIYSGILFLVVICAQTLPILIFWGRV